MEVGMVKFNPKDKLTPLKGKGGKTLDYLEVKHRILWLRLEHPNAEISTEILYFDYEKKYAVVKATIRLPGGGSATGTGMEERGDFHDFLEKAETKAIGRACAAAGYGTQFTDDFDFGDDEDPDSRKKVVDSPTPRASHLQDQANKLNLPKVPRPDATFVRTENGNTIWDVGGVECVVRKSEKGEWLASLEKCKDHGKNFTLLMKESADKWKHGSGQEVCYRNQV